MKVFQINTVYGSGSTGRIVAGLKQLLEKRGDTCVAAYGRGDTQDKDTYKIGSLWDMYVHGILTRITDRTGFYSKKKTKKLIEKIEESKPDIIHLHNLHGYYLHVPTLFDYLKKSDTPVIWTLHDCWPFTGHCAYYTKAGCGKWKSGCSHCPEKKVYPASKLLDNSLRNYGDKKAAFTGVKNLTIVTPSAWLAGEVKQSFLKDYQVQVLPNGIDTTLFCPTQGDVREKYHLGDHKLLLAVANQWTARKGYEDYLALAVHLPEEYQLVMVGLTEAQIKALPENIVGIGKTENAQELAQLYTESTALLNLTYEDNFPTVNLEALACGTPVITYRTGGSPEALDGNIGIVVEVGDLDAVQKAIFQAQLLQRDKCVQAGKEYDTKVRLGKYLDLYDTILSK